MRHSAGVSDRAQGALVLRAVHWLVLQHRMSEAELVFTAAHRDEVGILARKFTHLRQDAVGRGVRRQHMEPVKVLDWERRRDQPIEPRRSAEPEFTVSMIRYPPHHLMSPEQVVA